MLSWRGRREILVFWIVVTLLGTFTFFQEKANAEDQNLIEVLKDKVEFHTLIEAEANYSAEKDDEAGWNDSSDITVSTVEVDLTLKPAGYIGGNLVFLWEEDESDGVEVDQAYLDFHPSTMVPLYFKAGRFYPSALNRVEGYMLADPLTMEFGELQETAIEAGLNNDTLYLGVGAFKGDVQESGDSNISSFYAFFAYRPVKKDDSLLEVSVGYLSNLGDTDTLQDVSGQVEMAGAEEEEAEFVQGEVTRLVPAWSASLKFNYKVFHLEMEYIAALDSFKEGELDTDGSRPEPKPEVYNVDMGIDMLDSIGLGVRYAHSKDLGSILPENQWGISLSWSAMKYITVSGEYLYNEFETDDEERVFTLQIAFEY